jgi:hypothetical protein
MERGELLKPELIFEVLEKLNYTILPKNFSGRIAARVYSLIILLCQEISSFITLIK